MEFEVSNKEKSKIIMDSVKITDVFSNEALLGLFNAIFVDEKDRLNHRNWKDDPATHEDTQFYLSLPEELQSEITNMWAYEYAFYAYQLTLREFLEEFDGYIDCGISLVEDELAIFMKNIGTADFVINHLSKDGNK